MSDDESLKVIDDDGCQKTIPHSDRTNDSQSTIPSEEKAGELEINKKSNVCNICGKSFSKKYSLKTHYQIHAGVKPFICEICYKTFSKKCSLNIHSIIHTGDRPYMCDICDKSFARKTDLSKHHLIHTGEKPYVCDTCEKSFNHQSNLRKHRITHTAEKQHVCDICRQAFSHRNVLLNHLKNHYMEEAVTSNELADHKERSRIRNYLETVIKKNFKPCDKCNKSFVRSDRLQKHKLTHKGNGDSSHVCEVCDAKFSHKDDLQMHLLNHVVLMDNLMDFADELDFSTENGTGFDDQDTHLISPSVQQSNEKPITLNSSVQTTKKPRENHLCSICYKSFSRRASLKDHYLIHSGTKPHQCHVCQKSFSQKVTLKRHLLIHTGEKPHTCDICRKNFARKTSLRKHYITHSAQKLF